jgi:hypothetical protein
MSFYRNIVASLCLWGAFLVTPLYASAPDNELHPSLQNPDLWSYGADPYGSKVFIGDSLIKDGAARIAFHRAPKPAPDRNTWIELIYRAPAGNLGGTEAVLITYQCSEALLMKFSQRDFGEEGDNSYAHYQTLLPATEGWKTVAVSLADFSRPSWTPATSKEVGLILENVSAIYLAPALDDSQGGHATLNVKAIEVLPAVK